MARFTLMVWGFALLVAGDAAAQSFIHPFVDTTLTSPSTQGSASKAGVGIALGSAGFVGGEMEVAYYPAGPGQCRQRAGKEQGGDLLGNTLIGPTIGPVKAYGVHRRRVPA